MPRGDATRGAGLSTYYEPRLLSSRFFFSPADFIPDAIRRCLSPFRPLCIPSPLVLLPRPPSMTRQRALLARVISPLPALFCV